MRKECEIEKCYQEFASQQNDEDLDLILALDFMPVDAEDAQK